MRKIAPLLLKAFVRPFYRRNAGRLLFILILFFGAVGEIGGKSEYMGPIPQLHYQYAMILGMLSNRFLFILVFVLWGIYSEKCARFVAAILQLPEYSFLHELNGWETGRLTRWLFFVHFLLLLPVSLYSLAVMAVAFYKGWFLSGFFVEAYMIGLCLLNMARSLHQVRHPGSGKPFRVFSPSLSTVSPGASAVLRNFMRFPAVRHYWQILLRYTLWDQKLLLAGIKLFSCSVLWLGMRAVTREDYDIRMTTLFFLIGSLAHGVIVYRLRVLEEEMLPFYRGLPVTLARRLMQYAGYYFLLLLPEGLTLFFLGPVPLRYQDALALFLSAYASLLCMNSLLLIARYSMRSFLKRVLCLFGILYFFVMKGVLAEASIWMLVVSACLFGGAYYRYEAEARVVRSGL